MKDRNEQELKEWTKRSLNKEAGDKLKEHQERLHHLSVSLSIKLIVIYIYYRD